MFFADEAALRKWAASLVLELKVGEVILLAGPLGAGKTTFVRGALEGLGYNGIVRSPTFNLIQTFDTSPPVMHADLYRLANASDVGLEEYLDSHICFIEWPDRAPWLEGRLISIEFEGQGRRVIVS